MKRPHTSEPRSESIGKVEFASPELEAGKTLDIVLQESNAKGRSIMEISTAALSAVCSKQMGGMVYFAEERAAWDCRVATNL